MVEVWFVRHAEVTGEQPGLATLAEHLRSRRMFLLLDNVGGSCWRWSV